MFSDGDSPGKKKIKFPLRPVNICLNASVRAGGAELKCSNLSAAFSFLAWVTFCHFPPFVPSSPARLSGPPTPFSPHRKHLGWELLSKNGGVSLPLSLLPSLPRSLALPPSCLRWRADGGGGLAASRGSRSAWQKGVWQRELRRRRRGCGCICRLRYLCFLFFSPFSSGKISWKRNCRSEV